MLANFGSFQSITMPLLPHVRATGGSSLGFIQHYRNRSESLLSETIRGFKRYLSDGTVMEVELTGYSVFELNKSYATYRYPLILR